MMSHYYALFSFIFFKEELQKPRKFEIQNAKNNHIKGVILDRVHMNKDNRAQLVIDSVHVWGIPKFD